MMTASEIVKLRVNVSYGGASSDSEIKLITLPQEIISGDERTWLTDVIKLSISTFAEETVNVIFEKLDRAKNLELARREEGNMLDNDASARQYEISWEKKMEGIRSELQSNTGQESTPQSSCKRG